MTERRIDDSYTLYNESNLETLKRLPADSIDLVLTSPFYNTNAKASNGRTLQNTTVKEGQYNYVRYDVFSDVMTNEEYADYTVNLFEGFDKALKPNGCVLYNMSYGAENTEAMFIAINAVLMRTAFTMADVIVWKKRSALPNSCSSNKLTRICEFIFVFCRRSEAKTFHCNKRVTSLRKTGQKAYENIFNLIEAANNDGSCPYNKATFSTELCTKLLDLYAPKWGGARYTIPLWAVARRWQHVYVTDLAA
jgi:DNA modification methylase